MAARGPAGEATKKRARVDLLASLDARFESAGPAASGGGSGAAGKKPVVSKYTAQAAQATTGAASQQAYLHRGRKRKDKAGNGSSNCNSNAHKASATDDNKPSYDPLYDAVQMDMLRIGLKNCSLMSQVPKLQKPYARTAILNQYLSAMMADRNANTASDKLKNKVLQLDNPIKTTDAVKAAKNQAQGQTAKLMSARQRRKHGLHMIQQNVIDFSHAEKLSAIWKRYVNDVLASELNDPMEETARNARIQAKFRSLDLSGCPIEVTQSRNPCNVGINGVIMAEKQNVIQICCSRSSKMITLPKEDSRFRLRLSDSKSLLVDGEWIANRSK